MEPASSCPSLDSAECQYLGCQQPPVNGKAVCFWHDPDSDKSGQDVRPQLEILARRGESLAGYRLARANLEHIDLSCQHGGHGPDLSNVDFYRTNLRGAHLYRANMQHCSLLKADLSGANLNFANLSGANLLGLKLDDSRMEHVVWGRKLYQERQLSSRHAHHTPEQRSMLLCEAEEVCRGVRKNCETHGLFEEAGYFFLKEMTFRRLQYPLGSWQRWSSKLVDLFCGYGERPLRVFIFSAVLVLLCGLFYFIAGVASAEGILRFEPGLPWHRNLQVLLDALYFSVVTFTTLGYGDLTPVGPSRTLAALEAFIGNFSLALFVVVFVKKMTR